jgi:ATP-dependent helicase/nuclease subunit A
MSDPVRYPASDRVPVTVPAAAPGAALPRELILASAGSGKTFRISSQLIALLAAGERPEEVFASTFTRKAAGEILDRVLTRLADAALSADAAAELAVHAAPDRTVADSAFWLGVLERVVQSLHRLNIGTLDSFFVRAVRSFAQELGLPAEWTIADDTAQARIREQVLDKVFRTAEPAALITLLRAISGGRSGRSVQQSMLRRIRALVELHHAIDPHAGDAWSAFGPVGQPVSTAADRAALADSIAAAPVPLTTRGAPHAVWQKAVASAAVLVRDGDWSPLLGSALCRAALQAGRYSGHPVPAALCEVLNSACELARADVRARLADQAHALRAFTASYAAALETHRRDSGLFGFDDLTRYIAAAAVTGRPDLFYRLDARTRHVLLDEFQDTSLAQWQALEPLMEELLAGHDGQRAALLVADPKQSIYGWRGGTPDLVTAIRDRYALDTAVLAKSWRSSPVVLDFVNKLFGALDSVPMLEGDDVARDVAARWLQSFTPHAAHHASLPGHVRIIVGPADEGAGQDRPRLCRSAARLVAQLHRDAPDMSIGVLTRRNATVARLMFELKRLGIRASEEGGNPLTDAAAVTSVLALLRLADHPGNTVARYHVAKTPVGAAFDYADHTDDAATLRLSHRIRQRLVDEGYGTVLADVAARVQHACDARELRRLGQLVELAYRYEGEATLRPSDFVEWVGARRVEDAVAAGVRVMTVHQSKGLEFDAVVLPELDAPLSRGSAGAPLAYRPDPAGPVTRAFPYVSTDLMPLFEDMPELAAAVDQARAAELRDSLSSLYVAVTRARHAVHAVIRPDGAKGPGSAKTAARILREALAADPVQRIDEGHVLYERGSPGWHSALERPPQLPMAAPGRDGPLKVQLEGGQARRRTLPRRSPSELEGGSSVDLGFVLRLGAAAARDRGSIAHLWFEQVRWLEDGVPEDAALAGLARRVSVDLEQPALDELIGRFRTWLQVPAFRSQLSRSGFSTGATVEMEVPFMCRDGETLVEGVIDRLVTERADGIIRSATIIDFKTDAVADDAAVQARRAHYLPQMQAYRRAVAAMYGLTADRVTARLLFLEAGTVATASD